jgi:peptidoglycan/xylan/chitin deacetylase (PgdA/CDA1 family)
MATRIGRMFRGIPRFSSEQRHLSVPCAAAGVSETPLAREVFLTDDDGPRIGTEALLDIFGEEDIQATFFLTGEHASGLGQRDRQQLLVHRILREGHRVGNHGFRHFPEKRAEYADIYGDLSEAGQQAAFAANLDANLAFFQNLLGDQTLRMPLTRLPGDGSLLPHCVREVARIGLRHVGWDVEFAPNGTFVHVAACDWQGLAGVACSSPQLPAHGDVILIHGAHWRNKPELLRGLLRKLKDKGYRFALP